MSDRSWWQRRRARWRARPRWRRWLTRLRQSVAVLLLLAVAAVAVVLGSAWGTRIAVEQGLSFYDDLIPGSARLDSVDGAIIDRLVLRGLSLKDAAGVERVRLDRLVFDWVPWGAVEGEALVPNLELAGVRVLLGPNGDATPLQDLAPPPSDTPPPPPAEGPVELPLDVEAWVRLRAVQVLQEGGPPLVEPTRMDLVARGSGQRFEAAIHRLQTGIPEPDVRVQRLDLAASWDGARAQISSLTAQSNLGQVAVRDVAFDPGALVGQLRLQASGDAAALRPLLGGEVLPADPVVAVRVDGGLEGFAVDVHVGLGEAVQARISVKGALQPAPSLALVVDLDGVRPETLGLGSGAFTGSAQVHVSAPPTPLEGLANLGLPDLTVVAQVDCPGCVVPPIGRFDAQVDARLAAGAADAVVDVRALGATVALTAHVDGVDGPETAAMEARWQIDVPNVGRPARLGDIEDLSGRLRTSGQCVGGLETLQCEGAVGLRNLIGFGAAVERADLRFDVSPTAEPLRFDGALSFAGVSAEGMPGRAEGTLTAKGTPEDVELTTAVRRGAERVELAARIRPGPPLVVDLHRLDARGMGERVRSRRAATIRLVGQKVIVRRLRLAALGGGIEVDGHFNAAGSSDLKVALIDLDLKRARRFVPRDLAPGGRLTLHAGLRGPLRAPRLSADLDLQDLQLRGGRLGNLDVEVAVHDGRASLDLALLDGPDRSIQVDAEGPLVLNLATGKVAPRLGQEHHLVIKLKGADDHWLAPVLDLPSDTGFAVAGRVRVDGSQDDWKGVIALDGTARVARLDPVPFGVNATLGPKAQAVEVALAVKARGSTEPPAAVAIELKTQADVPALAGGAPLDLEQLPVDAKVLLPGVALAAFEALLPPALFQLVGTVDADIRVTGMAARPDVTGRVQLQDGAVTVVPLGQRLTRMTADLELADRRLDIAALDFRAGKGEGKVRGGITLTDGLGIDGDIKVRIEKMPIVAPGVPPSLLDSRITIAMNRADAQSPLETNVAIRRTTYRIVDLEAKGPRPIPTDANVIYVDKRARAEAGPPVELPPEPAEPVKPMVVKVRFADPITIIGPILDMEWGGEVTATIGEAVTVQGGLEARRGFIEILGNRFVIDEGTVSLPEGSAIPYVRITARAQTEEAVVTAKITGKATRPTLEFEAEPVMPTDLILTLLVTGSTTSNEEDKKSVEEQATKLLAGFQAPALEQAAQERLGVDRVRLTFGEGGVESPILSFGKHVTQWLYVEARYHHNPTEDENETELSATTELSRRWTLETSFGDRSIGSADVFWKVPLPRDD